METFFSKLGPLSRNTKYITHNELNQFNSHTKLLNEKLVLPILNGKSNALGISWRIS